jgi:TorA maturation chaperone TorD
MTDQIGMQLSAAAAPGLIDPRERAFAILARVASSRETMYRWLALGFYAPDDQFAEALISQRLVHGVVAALEWLGKDQRLFDEGLQRLQHCRAVTLIELAAGYQRLFGKGLDRVSPREAAYRWRDASDLLNNGETIARLLRLQYQQFNIAPIVEREDHVAVELEFLSFLCGREAESWSNVLPDMARQLRRQQKSFLDDHLGRWLAEFCQRVQTRTQSNAYQGLALLADAWLKLEHGPGYLPPVTKS